ncbi:MAG: methylase [Gammaproteobacteria bacterium]|nr:MAG: methylase [Gammaproteobacteria bacterium]RLA54393.1 MAG: methylase [Gammaproteobacteria bacterium]
MKLPSSPSCENNKRVILAILHRAFGSCQSVLEIGSGTGQHAVYFGPRLAPAIWQTSDLIENHSGINAWRAAFPADNVRPPLTLDVDASEWPLTQPVDAVFTANTCHIMAWSSVENMFSQLGNILALGGVLAIYGPFNYDQQYTSPSNARFDSWLKERGPHQGIRDFEAIDALANEAGMSLSEDNAMPANNRLLVWHKI